MTDDGGHYIGRRFGGPSDKFNHFAQDGNFNKGDYRALENGWEKQIKLKNKVIVRIESFYEGKSTRPRAIRVIYWVNGRKHQEDFPNHKKGS